jgi:hypothetical protein
MSRKSIIPLAIAAVLGIASVSVVATDAMAYRGGGVRAGGVARGGAVAYRGGAYRGGAVAYRGRYWRPGVGVGAAAVGAAASRPACGYYPYPPCY